MSFFKRLLGLKFIDLAKFTLHTSYTSSNPRDDEIPLLKVNRGEDLSSLSLDQQLFLTAAGVVEHSFYRVRGDFLTKALGKWEKVLSDDSFAEPIPSQSSVPAAKTEVTLRYGNHPFVQVFPRFEKSTNLIPFRLVTDTAISLYVWVRSQISEELLGRLTEVIEYGLSSWRLKPPNSRSSTWDWLEWIDPLSWVYDATGSYDIGGKTYYQYVRYSNQEIGIAFDHPDYYDRLGIINTDVLRSVDIQFEGRMPIRVYKDRGELVKVDISKLDINQCMEEVISRWENQSRSADFSIELSKHPWPVAFQDCAGLQVELSHLEHGKEMGIIIDACCKLDDVTLGGIYIWVDWKFRWMIRDVFNQIRQSVEFLPK